MANGSTWVRWGLGIVATLLIGLLAGILAWGVNRIDGIEATMNERSPLIYATATTARENTEKIDTILDTMHQLKTEMALLTQEIRLTRVADEQRRAH